MESNSPEFKKRDRALVAAFGIIIAVTLVLALLGFLFLRPETDLLQGQADATSVKVSGKLTGRVAEFYVKEGQRVAKGDTLVRIHSSLMEAKMSQAEAMQDVAEQQNRKVDNGAREQIKAAAYQLWQQAIAAENITRKTFERMESLYKQGVISEQKRDEAKAAYDAAVAASRAAKSQYDLAVEGAQAEDRASSASMVKAAQSTVDEVKALLEDQYLTAPCDGEIASIYPEPGELVIPGAPIMSVLKIDDIWASFNVREEYLEHLGMGSEVEVTIPALGSKTAKMKVYYIHDLGSYAVWSATKATGEYDSKTFEVKMRPAQKIEGLRPGMSVLIEK